MPRRVKNTQSFITPLMDNFIKRLSGTNLRLRRKIIKYCFWGVGMMFVYSLISGTYGIPRIIRLEMQKQELIQSNREELINLVDADRIKNMLLFDKEYIEAIARTRFHMVNPGEIIYRYRGQ